MSASKAIASTPEPVLVDRPGERVALLTLNRPHVHNALDRAALAALCDAFETLRDEPEVRAIVLTGTGKSFCSGDDLKALRTDTFEQFAEVIAALQALAILMVDSPKPIVAALNGPAFGAGLEMVLACDARLATRDFACATPETRLGLAATNGASLLLPMLIGQSRARDMLLTGRRKSADWCLEAGLIDEIVPAEALLSRALALAEAMSVGAPSASAAARRMLTAPFRAALDEALRIEEQACLDGRLSSECSEGVDAHFARRAPIWPS
jgi:enoyl-CoA hydratase/carnithine racemase